MITKETKIGFKRNNLHYTAFYEQFEKEHLFELFEKRAKRPDIQRLDLVEVDIVYFWSKKSNKIEEKIVKENILKTILN